jgi:hypothetical protein
VWIVAKEAKAAAPRKHHYVPQFYLRGFVGERDQLFVTDRPSEKSFRTPPKNVAAERDFNRVEIEGMDPGVVEKALAEFEGKVAPALERIKETKSLANKEDRDALMNLISALAIRNPRTRSTINDFIGELVQKAMEIGLATEERWNSQVAQMKKAGVWDEGANVSYADMKKMVEERRHKIEVAKEFNVAVELDQHDGLLQHLANRKWQLVVANEGSGGFVTTDAPVCIQWADGGDHGIYSPGFRVAGTEVIIPLSTKLALRGTFEGEEDVVEGDIFTVGSINSIVISNCNKQVYAHDHSFHFMRPLPQAIGSGATLLQDEQFLAAGKKPQEDNVIALRDK